jgi:hypothetical protein
MPIELSSRIVRAENLMSAPVDNEIVILNMAKSNYIGLDEIGLRLWEMFAQPCRVDELCDRLSREYEATSEQIVADVLPFLEELRSEGLIKVVA